MKPLREERRKNRPCLFAAELPATRATIGIGDDRFNGAWEVDIDKLGVHENAERRRANQQTLRLFERRRFKGELTPGTGAWTYLAYLPRRAIPERRVGHQYLGNTRIQRRRPTTACSTF